MNIEKFSEYKDLELFLNSELKKGILSVHFIKSDGSERKMVCTKNFDIIPEGYHPSQNNDQINEVKDITLETAIRVFDIESKGWRSFKLGKVLKVDNKEVVVIGPLA